MLNFKLVIHTEFGGFSLTQEMVDRLAERGCKWADKCGKSYGSNPKYYIPYEDDDELKYRSDADLIAVVEELTEEFESKVKELTDWRERRQLERTMLDGLKVVEVNVSVEIEDHDGKETVRVHGGAW